MSDQRTIGRAVLSSLLVAVIVLACASCATSATSSVERSAVGAAAAPSEPSDSCATGLEATGDSPTTARRDARNPADCARVKSICRWTITNSLSSDHSHTTPGSYTPRPPGSCPPRELNAVLVVAARLRLAGPTGIGICDLLTAEPLVNAKRIAAAQHLSCGQAAIQPAQGITPAARRISQPLTGVLLNSSSPGPAHWFGYLAFTSPGQRANPRDPRYTSLIVQIVKRANGNWAINQIGYQF